MATTIPETEISNMTRPGLLAQSSASSSTSTLSELSNVQLESGTSTPLTNYDSSEGSTSLDKNEDTSPGALHDAATAMVVEKIRSSLPPSSEKDYILVTGGLGYIGSHTTLELLKTGYNVIIVDNLANSFASVRWRLHSLAAIHCTALGVPTPELVCHELSYQSPAMRSLLEQYACADDGSSSRSRIVGVIHFAAHKSVQESINDPLAYYDNNFCGLVDLIRLLDEFHIRTFVFSSSATVYGSKANAGRPMQEDDVLHFPLTPDDSDAQVREPSVEGLTCPYARTKYFCEALLADVARSDPRWRIVVLRYFNPTGCDPSGALGEQSRVPPKNIFPAIAEVVAGRQPAFALFGSDWPTRDGTAVRDYIHVADVARGHIAALDTEGAAAGETFRVYNLGSGSGVSVLEVLQSIAVATGRPVPVQWSPRRDGDVGTCIASTDKASRELGWYPRESMAQSARDWWNFVQKVHNLTEKGESTVLAGH